MLIPPPEIPEAECTPLVRQLLDIIRLQQERIRQLEDQVHLQQERIGFCACGSPRPQMDLQIAVGRQDRGGRIGVLLVDRRNQLVQVGFGHAGHAQKGCADGQRRHQAFR